MHACVLITCEKQQKRYTEAAREVKKRKIITKYSTNQTRSTTHNENMYERCLGCLNTTASNETATITIHTIPPIRVQTSADSVAHLTNNTI